MRLTSCRFNRQACGRRTWLTAGNVVAIFAATAVALTAAGLTASPAHAAAAADSHVVVRGESLWRIAAAALPRRASDAQTATMVTRIAALNADDLPHGAHHLVAGQRLRMPGTASSRVRTRAPLALGAGYERPDGSKRVRDLQRTLRKRGYRPGPVDGLFGPRTRRAVLRFQRAKELVADGIVGTRTNARLHRGGRAPKRPAGAEQATQPASPVMPETDPQASRIIHVTVAPQRDSAEPGGWLLAPVAGLWVLGVMALLLIRLRARAHGTARRTPDAAVAGLARPSPRRGWHGMRWPGRGRGVRRGAATPPEPVTASPATAGISTRDGRRPPCSLAAGEALTVQPYDTSVIKAIERTILASDIVARDRPDQPVDPPASMTEWPSRFARQPTRVDARAYLSPETARSATSALPVEVELVVETSDLRRRTSRVGERGRSFSVPSTDLEGAIERLVRTNSELREHLCSMGVEAVDDVPLHVELTPALEAAAREKTAGCS